jgi:TRAP-type C4-dicarboxylate transport system substrate-binding protein
LKKGKFLLIPVLVLIVLVLTLTPACSSATTTTAAAATTSAPSGQVYKLTYAMFLPPAAAIAVTGTEFAKAIEAKSNGRIQITIQQGGSLLAAPAMYQGVLDGIADIGMGITSYNPGNFPFTSIIEAPAAGQSGWVVSNAMGDFLEKYQPAEWSKVKIIAVTGTSADLSTVNTVKSPINTMADFKGKSIRNNLADVITALGASLKDLPMADVYDGLSKGVIDGVTGQGEMLKSWKLADVAKYNTMITAPVQPSIVWYNIMNKNKFNSLPADLQKVIVDVGKEYQGKFGVTWDNGGVVGIAYAKSLGNTISVFSAQENAAFAEAIKPVITARLKALTDKGFTQAQVDEAWAYFQSRIAYWNGQQAANNVVPALQRMIDAIK